MTRTAGALLALVLVVAAAAYGPSLRGDWVYDDHRFVERNQAVEEGTALHRYFTDPSTQARGDSHEGLYRPVRTLSYRLVRLVAPGPVPQRIANLVLHLLNGILVWILLERLMPKIGEWGPLAGAAAFLLHPVGAESVAWISSRGDLLALTGLLGATVLHLGARRRGASVAVAALFALALLSKESAAVLPLLLVLGDLFRGGWRRVRTRWRRYAPSVGVLLLLVVLRRSVLDAGAFDQGAGMGLELPELTGALLTGFAVHLRDLLLPLWISFEVRPDPPDRYVTAGALLLLLLVVAAVLLRRRARVVPLAVGWLLVVLLPVTALQYVFPLKIIVAGRFLYPALVAVAVLVAWITARGRGFRVAAAVLLAALVPLTWERAAAWHDDRSLWSDVLAVAPHDARALYGLGFRDLRDGNPALARDRLRRAALIDGSHPGVAAALGDACWLLAMKGVHRSEEQQSFLAEAYSAYHAAAMLWFAGSREDRHLYRETALRAAWLAKRRGEPDWAAHHVREAMEKAPGRWRARPETAAHLRELAEYFAPRYPELGAAVGTEAARVEREIAR